MRALLLLCAGAIAAQDAGRFTPKAERVQFALIGDQQYTPLQEKLFENVIDSMNKEKLAFVVHDGDITNGDGPCDDALFTRRLRTFSRSTHPFVFTPGDNDWTDCRRPFDPLERLAKLRMLFVPAPGRTLGKRPMAVVSQGEPYVENLMWTKGPVLFATGRPKFAGRERPRLRPSPFEGETKRVILELRDSVPYIR